MAALFIFLFFSYIEQMQENVRKEFLPLVSRPGWMITWLMRIFGIALLLVMFIVLLVFPFLVCERMEILVIVALLYYPVWVIAMYHFFRYLKKSRNEAIIKITVDDKGVHYDKMNGGRDEVLYSQLGKSYLSEEYEVYLARISKIWVLAVGIDGHETKLQFGNTDAAYSYYTKNGRALRARFIQGITYFRPDLKVDPFVFEEFCIDPEKFTFDRKRYLIWIFKYAVFAIILLIGSALLFLLSKIIF